MTDGGYPHIRAYLKKISENECEERMQPIWLNTTTAIQKVLNKRYIMLSRRKNYVRKHRNSENRINEGRSRSHKSEGIGHRRKQGIGVAG